MTHGTALFVTSNVMQVLTNVVVIATFILGLIRALKQAALKEIDENGDGQVREGSLTDQSVYVSSRLPKDL